MRENKIGFLPISIILILSLAACTTGQRTPTPTISPPTIQPTPAVTVYIIDGYGHFLLDSFDALMKVTHLVVIGKVEAEQGVIIQSPDKAKDQNQPHRDPFSFCSIYRVRVEQVVFGDADEELVLCHGGGMVPAEYVPGDLPSESQMRQVIAEHAGVDYIALEVGHRYLMFLRRIDPQRYRMDGSFPDKLYARAADPWLFDLSDENAVQVLDIYRDVREKFPPRPLDEIVESIREAAP
jgi:hypothetical protein